MFKLLLSWTVDACRCRETGHWFVLCHAHSDAVSVRTLSLTMRGVDCVKVAPEIREKFDLNVLTSVLEIKFPRGAFRGWDTTPMRSMSDWLT